MCVAEDHPAVIDELMPRLIHCCYADKWPQRVGGVAAVSMVVQKLPMPWLQTHMPDVVKAALAVLKHLPSHASLEQAQLLKSLTTIMHLVIPQVSPASTCFSLFLASLFWEPFSPLFHPRRAG